MEENKYINYINRPKEPDEKVEMRRRKRRRARVLAFISFAVIIALVVTGVVIVVNHAGGNTLDFSKLAFWKAQEKPVEQPENTDEVISALEDILGNEEQVSVTPHVQEDPGPTEEELYTQWLDEKIALMPLEDKVMGLFIVRPEAITGVDTVIQAGDGTKAALEQYPVGGFLYSDKNAVSKDKFTEMLKNTVEFSKYPMFLAYMEEPGNGTLAAKLSLPSTRTQSDIGATMDPYAAYTDNKIIADYLKETGINFSIGFSADVCDSDDPALYMSSRSYGTDPVIVSRMVQESANAFREAGIFAAMGFFPGQGGLTDDPGSAITSITYTVEEIRAKQYEVYKAGIDSGVNAIIVSHAYAEGLSSDNVPCSMSKSIYKDLLREDFKFSDVILITDCLDKPSITEYYTSGEACVKAIKAGADMVMCPENFEEGYNAVLEAVKSNVIAEERINDSLRRVYRVKYKNEYDQSESATFSESEGETDGQ